MSVFPQLGQFDFTDFGSPFHKTESVTLTKAQLVPGQ